MVVSAGPPICAAGFFVAWEQLPRDEVVVFFFSQHGLTDKRVSRDEEATVVRRARKRARSFIPSRTAGTCMYINKGGVAPLSRPNRLTRLSSASLYRLLWPVVVVSVVQIVNVS